MTERIFYGSSLSNSKAFCVILARSGYENGPKQEAGSSAPPAAASGERIVRMAMTQPLMPMATAVWLVDNTALTFKQIADFCGLHELEIQAIADETIGMNIVGHDPIASGQLDQHELDRCQKNPEAVLHINEDAVKALPRTKGPRYTPVSRRQDKPDAIAWLVRHHPELSDLQISRLVGTTKPTIQSVRERGHWNIQNIRPRDPVALGLCRQLELDEAVRIASDRRQKLREKEGLSADGERAEDALIDAAEADKP